MLDATGAQMPQSACAQRLRILEEGDRAAAQGKSPPTARGEHGRDAPRTVGDTEELERAVIGEDRVGACRRGDEQRVRTKGRCRPPWRCDAVDAPGDEREASAREVMLEALCRPSSAAGGRQGLSCLIQREDGMRGHEVTRAHLTFRSRTGEKIISLCAKRQTVPLELFDVSHASRGVSHPKRAESSSVPESSRDRVRVLQLGEIALAVGGSYPGFPDNCFFRELSRSQDVSELLVHCPHVDPKELCDALLRQPERLVLMQNVDAHGAVRRA